MDIRQIKQMFRVIFRNRTYSILNIAGLATGITCAALILLWVEDEMTYDDFPKRERLYMMHENQTYSGVIHTFPVVPNPLAAALKEEVPGVRDVTRIVTGYLRVFALNEKILSETGAFVDASIFEMLDIQFVYGDASTAFDGAYPVVLTEEMAERFFGNENPLGQTLKVNNAQIYTVTGVVCNPKRNSSLSYSWLIPFQQLLRDNAADGWAEGETSWHSNWLYNLVELEASADVAAINDRVKNMLKEKKQNPDDNVTLFLYPLAKLHLYNEFIDGKPTGSGEIRKVKMFSWIAALILAIACINFMNLSTARSQKRIKEVGMRKTLGAKRIRLVRQFMTETAIVTFTALFVAAVMIIMILPQYHLLIDKHLTLDAGNARHWLGLLSIGVLCTFLAGGYPAFFLSSFPPMDMLRKLRVGAGSGTVWLRKTLVVFQFTASLTLIICTAFIYLQIRHVGSRSLGMDVEQVLMVHAGAEIRNRFEPLKQELFSTGVVENAGLSSVPMLDIWSSGGGLNWQGKSDNIDPLVSRATVSDNLLPTLGIKISDGRYFEPLDGEKKNVIINRTLADLMGEEGCIGGRIWWGNVANDENTVTVIGIIEDFVFNSPFRAKSEPLLIQMDNWGDKLFIRLRAGDAQASIRIIEDVFRRIDPNHPLEYRFMDEEFNRKFASTRLVGRLSGWFGVFAVFISCLGLFGLTAFAAEQRTREIAIRKVLGATVTDVVVMLGRNFMALLGISLLIAIPLAWRIMHGWLQDYEYRIGLSWWVFVASGALVVAIALLTVGFQAVKAATANPVKAIKSE